MVFQGVEYFPMPKSSAFIQIKEDVLAIVTEVPVGNVTTYGAIGEHLNVMARHVAYILATLTDEERESLPWHRVVGNQGAIATGKLTARHRHQIEDLQAEGILCNAKNIVQNFDELFCSPDQLVNWNHSSKRYLVEQEPSFHPGCIDVEN
jgi:methylated-DNA-protein-cysteine methyltransferase related protein